MGGMASQSVEIGSDDFIMTKHVATETILVIEDDDATRDLLRQILEELNVRVLLEARGEVGLERARDEHPNLVLVDLILPGLDGAAVVRALKSDPATSGTKVIVMSGGGHADRVRAQQAGCDAFVAKPFDLDDLESTIRSFLPSLADRRTREA
jgi:DNA-binding response OmpR family regulator